MLTHTKPASPTLQDVSHMFPALPLLTRLAFVGEADPEGDGDAEGASRLGADGVAGGTAEVTAPGVA